MNELVISLGAIAILGLIVLVLVKWYGNSKKKIGKTERQNQDENERQERESKAKAIESEPSPTDPDDVADSFDRLRRPGNEESS